MTAPTPTSLPTREEIADALHGEQGHDLSACHAKESWLRDADRVLARLRPTWERLRDLESRLNDKGECAACVAWKEEVDHALSDLGVCSKHTNSGDRPAGCRYCIVELVSDECDALRADLAEERKIVDRVWKALGVESYEAAGGKSIDEIVADLKADLARVQQWYDEGAKDYGLVKADLAECQQEKAALRRKQDIPHA